MSSKGKIGIVLAAALILAAGFLGGYFYSRSKIPAHLPKSAPTFLHPQKKAKSSFLQKNATPQKTQISKTSGSLSIPEPVKYPVKPLKKITSKPEAQSSKNKPPVTEQPSIQTTALPLFLVQAGNLQYQGSNGVQSAYTLSVNFINREKGTEIISPEDIELQDQFGRVFSSYNAYPELPNSGILPGYPFAATLFFKIPANSIPQKLIIHLISGVQFYTLKGK